MADDAREPAKPEETAAERLTLWDALADLGWFSIVFAVVVGGPSVLSILQAVFVEHRLIAAFQWIVDGWNAILAVAVGMVEPALTPLLTWLNTTFGWGLVLHPHWRATFALMTVFVLAGARTEWRRGRVDSAIRYASIAGLGSLLGAIGAGLVPLAGGWWAQGLAAALPIGLVTLAVKIEERDLRRGIVGGMMFGGAVFIVAAAFSLLPGFAAGAGVLALGALVSGTGVGVLALAIARNIRSAARLGLTIIGGFVAAGLILAADAMVKVLS